jgi:hypothetical protein
MAEVYERGHNDHRAGPDSLVYRRGSELDETHRGADGRRPGDFIPNGAARGGFAHTIPE